MHPLTKPHYRIEKRDAKKHFEEVDKIKNSIVSDSIRESVLGLYGIENDISNTQNEIGVFLKYLFPTPINRSAGQREWKETVPVEDSFFFLFLGSKQFRPFEKTGYEKFAAMSEDMKIIETVLPEDYSEYFVEKINGSVSEFNKNMQNVAKRIKTIGTNKTEENKDLKIDVKIANYALAKMKESKAWKKGIYAILLNTSLARIKSYLKKEINDFNNTRDCIIYLRRDFDGFLEANGYKQKISLINSDWGDYVKEIKE